MANDEHVAMLKKGVTAWNRWRGEDPYVDHPDLSGENLTKAHLPLANLIGVNLTGANLTEAMLFRANLSGANLSGANLTKALLPMANLTGANLTGAILSEADLLQANLSGANLTRATITQAQLDLACGDPSTKLPPGRTIAPCKK